VSKSWLQRLFRPGPRIENTPIGPHIYCEPTGTRPAAV